MTLISSPPRQAGARTISVRLPRLDSAWVLFWVAITGLLVLPIALFLVVAVSPRLLDQGTSWFTLEALKSLWTPTFLPAVINSLVVGVAAGVGATAVGVAVAWGVLRTNLPLRRVWGGVVFGLLLAPSYLIALGWERLAEPSGVLDVLGVPDAAFRSVVFGPVGVVVVLAVKGFPFAYLAVSSALRGLGDEFESAARVHGAGRVAASRVVLALIAPALWSAFAIVFAESVSDFGVGATLANDAHFPLATYTLYNAVDAFPVDFPSAAAVGWVLLAMVGVALFAQNRAMRGRSYQVLNGRNRDARLRQIRGPGRAVAMLGMLIVLLIAVGVPVFGALSASLISGMGSLTTSHALTLSNYTRVLSSSALHQPLIYSIELGLLTATATITLALVSARLLAKSTGTAQGRILDLLLLTAVALPGIVFAAGYIFTYNLPLTNELGLHLYDTTALLFLAYVATALPSATRLLVGAMSQLQDSLHSAARVHGAGPIRAWMQAALPLIARPTLSAWLLIFSGTLLELPVSQLLYVPGSPPLSIGIESALSKYDFGGGTAMEVIAIGIALIVMAIAWTMWRLFAPVGWRRIGAAR